MSVSNICCSVCFDAINSTESVDATKCGHLFHRTCILKWLHTNRIAKKGCPVCRRLIKSETLITVYPQLNAIEGKPKNIDVINDFDVLVKQLNIKNDLLDSMREENCQLSNRLTELNETIDIYRQMHNIDRFNLLKQNLKSIDFEIETVSESISVIEERIVEIEEILKKTENDLRIATII